MAKAQIKVGRNLVKPKAIKVFRDGKWQQSVGYIFKNEKWIPFIQYRKVLYENGVEHVPFDYYLSPGDRGGFERRPHSLYMHIQGESYAQRSIYTHTSEKVDITNFSKLIIEVEASLNREHVQGSFNCGISATTAGSYVARYSYDLMTGGGFGAIDILSRRHVTIDISSFTGMYYIKTSLHFNSGQPGVMDSNLFKMYLE